MESPRKFNDCYFYYYSTCTKGDNCVFRHEPSALGCETMCSAWQQGKCMDKRCKLRHMELRKNRKQIPCYWENQPGGCRKKHCPFMHKNPDARTDGIAPSQPQLPISTQVPAAEGGVEAPAQPLPVGAVPAPAPAPVPLFWQQQRQVVLDPAILDALPAGGELLPGGVGVGGLGVRRLHAVHAHAHAHHEPAPGPYAPMPQDPLVVNFEEESDNESAPSSTPTKPGASPPRPRDKQALELLLLERIQAEAAAYYSYDSLPDTSKDRKIVRTNLSTKYDRLSLDEIAGKQANTERRSSLDFKILSLDEIRARKKGEAIVHSTPITLNLSRKRKLSTQESVTTSGDKIIKVVRSNSIVYKKVDHNAPAATSQKSERRLSESAEASRKRTLSEQSDVYEVQEDELVDNCYEFKRIKLAETTSKPRLIRNRHISSNNEAKEPVASKTDDSDTEVQIVSIDISDCTNVDLSNDVVEIENTTAQPVDIVDLSDDEDCEVMISDYDLGLIKNVPDVVASCQKNTNSDNIERDLLTDIDNILDDVL